MGDDIDESLAIDLALPDGPPPDAVFRHDDRTEGWLLLVLLHLGDHRN